MDELSGQTIKGYEFIEKIGAGGFGAVYRAYQPLLKRKVAIKVVLPQHANQPDFVRRFEVEAELVARLEHPHIVPLFDYWREPDSAYLVMRLLSGGSLRQALADGAWDVNRVTRMLDQITAALSVAHRNGVVHRDIKPDNILLDEDNNAYLADFGIAKRPGVGSKSADDTITGSIQYAAPEQIQSAPVSPQTDIYSLGVVIYEMLTGGHPFGDASISELILKHLQEPLPDILLQREDLPGALNDVLQTATAKDPQNRYLAVRDLFAAFQAAQAYDIPPQLLQSTATPEPERTPTVFISYAHHDSGLANRMIDSLQQVGHACWIDRTEIKGGEAWTQAITEGINNSYAFISIVSERANQSTWVQREFLLAERSGKPIYPVWAEACELPIYMIERQAIPIYEDYETRLKELITALPSPPGQMPTTDTQEPAARYLLTTTELKNPFKGLRAFQETDSEDFFGRDALIERLLERVGQEDDLSRFLAVVGPSGSGKSSVVKAGLIPALRQGALPDSDKWFIVEMYPGAHPMEELEAALLRVAVNPPGSLLGQLREDERGLLRAAKRILPPDDDTDLLLVIDQFEELFTLVEDEVARSHFLDSLLTALEDPRSRLRVIVTLRADFYDRPLQYRAFGEIMTKRTEVVLPMSSEELEQAISGPTEQVGAMLEPGLATTIGNDVDEQPGTLPLLQYALTELFERRRGRVLTLDAYNEIGGVTGALARRAEEIYIGLDDNGQEATRQLLLRLVTLGQGTEDTRRRVRRAELASGEGEEYVIDAYGKARLLTFDRDPVTRGPTVEVAHEALIRTWERLREWVAHSREDLKIQRRLTQATAEWQESGHDPGFLATETRLAQFEAWATGTDLALNEDERIFLAQSIAHREKRREADEQRRAREIDLQRRATNRTRYLAGASVVILLLIIGAALVVRQAAEARNNAQQTQVALGETATVQAHSPTPTLTPAPTITPTLRPSFQPGQVGVQFFPTDAPFGETPVFEQELLNPANPPEISRLDIEGAQDTERDATVDSADVFMQPPAAIEFIEVDSTEDQERIEMLLYEGADIFVASRDFVNGGIEIIVAQDERIVFDTHVLCLAARQLPTSTPGPEATPTDTPKVAFSCYTGPEPAEENCRFRFARAEATPIPIGNRAVLDIARRQLVEIAPIPYEEAKRYYDTIATLVPNPLEYEYCFSSYASILDDDGDGIPYPDDWCLNLEGSIGANGCPDADGDGFPDPGVIDPGVEDAIEDECPNEAGLPEYNGCQPTPTQEEVVTTTANAERHHGQQTATAQALDSDGDGIPYPDDWCLNLEGSPQAQGCPDADGDGFPDQVDEGAEGAVVDQCPNETGLLEYSGCQQGLPRINIDSSSERVHFRLIPDPRYYLDGDDDQIGYPDICFLNIDGPAKARACSDIDGDGVPDQVDGYVEGAIIDLCPNEAGFREYDGCPPTPTVTGTPPFTGTPEAPGG